MPRIRTIKPELPQSETIGRLSREARLLFVLLFTVADDAGRTRASSRLLASLLYPYDDDAPDLIDDWLAELVQQKQIRLYEVDGSRYLEIIKWLEHQKIDRPSASKLPAFRDTSSDDREDSRGVVVGPVSGPVSVSGGGEDQRPLANCSKSVLRSDFEPTEESKKALVLMGFGPAQIAIEIAKFKTYYIARGYERANWDAQLISWFQRTKPDASMEAASDVSPAGIVGKVFVEEGTPEWAAQQDNSRRTKGKGTPITDWDAGEGRMKRGWWFLKRVPDGYDEATGERLPTKAEDAA